MNDAAGGGFGKFVPGFEFLQNLAGQAASGMAQGLGNSLPQMPNLSHWVAPTFNVEELEKRIEELKAVHYWLDQNSKALAATIQALEVQKMTLATLKNMNFSLGDVANALKIKAADTVSGLTGVKTQFAGLEVPPRTYGSPVESEPATPPAPPPAAPAARKKPRKPAAKAAAQATASAGGLVDPMQWWGALTQQFQGIAANAMKDMAKQGALDATKQMASGLTEQAVKSATGMAGKAADSVARNVGNAVGMGQAAVRAVGDAARASTAGKPEARKPAAKRSAPARKVATAAPTRRAKPRAPAPVQSLSPGDWTMPAAFFPGFQPVAKAAPAKPPASPRNAARKTAGTVAKKVVKKAPQRSRR